ncbi:MAG: hypothetical protein ACE5H4_16305 [Candidatus Thorarchaeota archaeon]
MPYWTPRRMTAFLTIWTLVVPLKVIIDFTHTSVRVLGIYAAFWAYAPGNPIYSSPLVLDVLYTLFMIPFYFPGIVVAWFVWHGSSDRNMTRRRYVEIVVTMQVIHLLIVWILFPCPISYSPLLCAPTSITGLLALPFVSRIVKDIDSPWAEHGN